MIKISKKTIKYIVISIIAILVLSSVTIIILQKISNNNTKVYTRAEAEKAIQKIMEKEVKNPTYTKASAERIKKEYEATKTTVIYTGATAN